MTHFGHHQAHQQRERKNGWKKIKRQEKNRRKRVDQTHLPQVATGKKKGKKKFPQKKKRKKNRPDTFAPSSDRATPGPPPTNFISMTCPLSSCRPCLSLSLSPAPNSSRVSACLAPSPPTNLQLSSNVSSKMGYSHGEKKNEHPS